MFLPIQGFTPNQFESRAELLPVASNQRPVAVAKNKSTAVLDRILAAASDLFGRHGIKSVSVDTIIRQAEVAKPSLYRLFGSKDWLALAYLERHEERFWNKVDAISALHPDDATEQLLTLIDWIARDASQSGNPGCPLTHAGIEYRGEDHPVRAAAIAHKQAMRRHLLDMTGRIGVRDPALLADQLMLLIEGANVIGAILPDADSATPLGRVARALIAANI